MSAPPGGSVGSLFVLTSLGSRLGAAGWILRVRRDAMALQHTCPVFLQVIYYSCHVRSHSVTYHPTQVNTPTLTPARQTDTRFTYPG